MAGRREKEKSDQASGERAASRRRTYEYNHQYGIELQGRAVTEPPKKTPAPPPKRKS